MLQQVVAFYSNAMVQECADAYYQAFQHLGIDTLRVNKGTYCQYENEVDLVLVLWSYEFLEEHFNYYNRAKIALLLMDEPYEVDHTRIGRSSLGFPVRHEFRGEFTIVEKFDDIIGNNHPGAKKWGNHAEIKLDEDTGQLGGEGERFKVLDPPEEDICRSELLELRGGLRRSATDALQRSIKASRCKR